MKENNMSQQKYYVVWKGKNPGIYQSWEACKQQVHGFQGARYKSFKSYDEAKQAYKAGYQPQKKTVAKTRTSDTNYILDSVSVDAACSGNPGDMEYRGVHTETGEQLFHYGPVANGTNNIGEFLAIVHALALLKQQNSLKPIYSDSVTAISWVKNKRVNTTLDRNDATERIWQLIDRALRWLHNYEYSNELLKWETKKWGESKADFGRK